MGSNSIDTTNDSPETPENYDEVCGEADTYHQWGQLIGNWSDVQRKKPKFVRDMVRRGVPNALRGMVWQLLCEAREFPLRDQYPQLIKVHAIFEFIVSFKSCTFIKCTCYVAYMYLTSTSLAHVWSVGFLLKVL